MKRVRDIRDLRSEIIAVLSAHSSPLLISDVAKRLRISNTAEDAEYFRTLIATMADEGVLETLPRKRIQLNSKPIAHNGYSGVVQFINESAVVTTNNPDVPHIIVRRQHMLTALSGDTVLVQPHAVASGKKVRGEITEILERSSALISGTIEYDGSFFYVIPDESKYHVDFLVNEKNLNNAKTGDKVLAKLLRWDKANLAPEVVITEVVGKSGKAIVEFAAIRKEFKLPSEFSPDAVSEAEAALPPPSKVPKGRVDCTKELIVTIDPDDARDFDDALSLTTLKNGNVELGVHIADVTHYVQEGSALDREAVLRGNSTYLVDGVVPMLPERLSNNLCSLVPGENRFAFSVFMEFSSRGTLKNYRIEETVIHSKRRYSYEEVQKIIEGADGDNKELILSLRSLANTLYDKRMKGGGIDFETQEVKFILNEEKMPIGAKVKTRTDATSLVEECMLAANKTVAEHLNTLKKKWKTKELPPLVYRVHDEPETDRIGDAIAVIRSLGFSVPNGKLGPREVNAILAQTLARPEKPVVNTLLLRSMAKAIYSEVNIGHYGLGFADYAHFTSPIRRYPDLFVHRVLKEYAKGKPSETRWKKLLDVAAGISNHCTQTERTSVESERASVKLAQVLLAQEHVGESFEGFVTGLTGFGIFVTIKEHMIEGLLHIRDISDDYYYFDEKRFRLVGRRKHRVFQYGTQVSVTIVKASLEKRTIDLRLVLPPSDSESQGSAGSAEEANKPAHIPKPPDKKKNNTLKYKGQKKRR